MPKDHYLPGKRKNAAQRTVSWDYEKQLDEKINRLLKERCTPKQAEVLEKYGYPTDISRLEAKRIINELRRNGWRRDARQEDETT